MFNQDRESLLKEIEMCQDIVDYLEEAADSCRERIQDKEELNKQLAIIVHLQGVYNQKYSKALL